MKMRKKAGLLVATFAAVAVMVPASSASAALTTDLSQVISSGALTVDIVDATGQSVASPSVSFADKTFSFDCQDSTSTFGTASEKILVTNPVKDGVKVDLSAVNPTTDVWSNGTESYKFNDPSGTVEGCDAGQLSVSGGTFTKTSNAAGPTTSAANMPGGGFSGTSPVTLLNIDDTKTFRAELTDYTLTQKIPAEQAEGTYTLPMNITYTAI